MVHGQLQLYYNRGARKLGLGYQDYLPKIHEDTAVNLPITKYALSRSFVQVIHFRLAPILCKSSDQDLSFVIIEELGCLRPVCSEEL